MKRITPIILLVLGVVSGSATNAILNKTAEAQVDQVTHVSIPATDAAIESGNPCNLQSATAGGQAFTCPLGGIRNIVDIEGGTKIPGEPNKLNLNIGAGAGKKDRSANGHVVINPDNGRCTIIEQGVVAPYRRIAIFCPRPNRGPIIRLYGQVIVKGSLKVRKR